MDSSPEPVNNRSVSETGANRESSDSTSNSLDTNTTPIQPSVDTVEPSAPVSPIQSRVPTPPPTVAPSEEIEHAYWAEFQEDTTTPDEEELKEINGADADYSACDR